MSRLSGGCLCGSLRYGSDAEPILTGLCHCQGCQRQSGSSYSVNVAMPRGSVQIAGPTIKTYEVTGDSGQPVTRVFCSNCGTTLVSFTEAMPAMEFLKAGTLDDKSWLQPTMEIWCEEAQPWVVIDESRQIAARNPQIAA